MKISDEKVNIRAFRDAKKLYLGGRGYIIQSFILSDDHTIYTYVNMYIAFVTPVMDVRDRDQV